MLPEATIFLHFLYALSIVMTHKVQYNKDYLSRFYISIIIAININISLIE